MSVGYEESQYEIPQSRGMPPVVRYLFGVCLVMIFAMGTLSIYFAGEFHGWPASQTREGTAFGSVPLIRRSVRAHADIAESRG